MEVKYGEEIVCLLSAANNNRYLAVKLSSLRQVKELISSSSTQLLVSILSQVLPSLLHLHSSPFPLVRKLLLEVIEEIGLSVFEHWSLLIPVILVLVKDREPVVSNAVGIKLFSAVLEDLALQFQRHGEVERWTEEVLMQMIEFKDAVVSLVFEPVSVGTRLLALKFLEYCVSKFTPDVADSDRQASGVCGLGKETRSPPINDEYCLCHWPTGGVLRVAVSAITPLGIKSKDAMEMGELLFDDLVVGMIDEALKKLLCQKDFILAIVQAQNLHEMLEKLGVKVVKLLNFATDDFVLQEIVTGCWIHLSSGSTDHTNYPGEANINSEEEDWPQKLATLPDELIVDIILPRLPIKSLLRFKSVCKDWCSTISTPVFAKSCQVVSKSRHQFVLLVEDDAPENHNYRMVRVGYTNCKTNDNRRIVGCCNGLVGFSSSVSPTEVKFIVLNPATGQRVEVLAPDDDDFPKLLFWFGYVSSLDDYKIVGFSHEDGAFWTFSFKTGIWRKNSYNFVQYKFGNIPLCARLGKPALVDDSLYWPIDVILHSRNVGTEIVELNLVSEEYEVKPRMNFAVGRRDVHLFNLKGCLALHTTWRCLDVWILRQKDDWNSWDKFYSSKAVSKVELIHFSMTGKLLVYVDHVNRLKIVDDLSQFPPEESHGQGDILIEHIGWLIYHGVGDYVESLIWPFRRPL